MPYKAYYLPRPAADRAPHAARARERGPFLNRMRDQAAQPRQQTTGPVERNGHGKSLRWLVGR